MSNPDFEINAKTSAIVLAGGKSSRMGQDKSLLKIEGMSLLERVIHSVSSLATEVIVMLSQSQKIPAVSVDEQCKIRYGRDSLPERGPLQGIADAIPHMSKEMEYVFVLSCDLPHLTREWLHEMRQTLVNSESVQIVCSHNNQHLNPLIAVYSAAALKDATYFVRSGKSSCLALLDDKEVIRVSPPTLQSHVISNVNTPLDYQEALKKTNQ